MKTPTEDEAEAISGDPCPHCGDGVLGIYDAKPNAAKTQYTTYTRCGVCKLTGEPYVRPASRVRKRGPRRRAVAKKLLPADPAGTAWTPPPDTGRMDESLPLPPRGVTVGVADLPALTGIPRESLGLMALYDGFPKPVVNEGIVLFEKRDIQHWLRCGCPTNSVLPPRNEAERERVGWMHRTFNERAREAVARLKAEAAGAN